MNIAIVDMMHNGYWPITVETVRAMIQVCPSNYQKTVSSENKDNNFEIIDRQTSSTTALLCMD